MEDEREGQVVGEGGTVDGSAGYEEEDYPPDVAKAGVLDGKVGEVFVFELCGGVDVVGSFVGELGAAEVVVH